MLSVMHDHTFYFLATFYFSAITNIAGRIKYFHKTSCVLSFYYLSVIITSSEPKALRWSLVVPLVCCPTVISQTFNE